MSDVPDPRVFSPAAEAARMPLVACASRVAEAVTREALDDAQRRLADCVRMELDARRFDSVDRALAGAPSVEVWRALWRAVRSALMSHSPTDATRLEVFAIPVSIVAAAPVDTTLAATLRDVPEVVRLLRDHRLAGGSESIALGDALVSAARLPMRTALALSAPAPVERTGAVLSATELPPDPLPVVARQEQVHLRFLVGTALCTSRADRFDDVRDGKLRMALTRVLTRQLEAPPATVLPLAGSVQRVPVALVAGLRAQREVALHLFVGNTIRRFRSRVGEPTAILSAHRTAGVEGRGELRLSLSSSLEESVAEGFRCPLFPGERVADVAAAIVELLAECGVWQVRELEAIHPDLDPASGCPLFFRSTDLPPSIAPHALQ